MQPFKTMHIAPNFYKAPLTKSYEDYLQSKDSRKYMRNLETTEVIDEEHEDEATTVIPDLLKHKDRVVDLPQSEDDDEAQALSQVEIESVSADEKFDLPAADYRSTALFR